MARTGSVIVAALLLLGCQFRADVPESTLDVAREDRAAGDADAAGDVGVPDRVEPDHGGPDRVETDAQDGGDGTVQVDTVEVVTCAGPGEHAVGKECCKGLGVVAEVYMDQYTGECSGGESKELCVACGDKQCKGPENPCNCEPDCGEPMAKMCAGMGADCGAHGFCLLPDGDCGATGASGTCTPRPEACDEVMKPVCGCDGKTYENACVMQSAGMSKAHDGKCEVAPD